MSNYTNLHEAELVDRPREVGTSYKYPSIPLTYRDELKKKGFVQGRRASEWLKEYKGYNIVCLERSSRHSVDVIIKKDKKYLTSKKAYSEEQIWDVITEYENKIDTFRKDPYDRDTVKENEDIMNIYEKLNKIDDTESLSEKYNVNNAKELKKLQESSSVNLRAGRQQKLETFMDYINDKAIELGFDINPATEAHVLTNQRRNVYLSWNYFVGDPQIVLSVSLAKNGYRVSAALDDNDVVDYDPTDPDHVEKSEEEVYRIIDELLASQHNMQNLTEASLATLTPRSIRSEIDRIIEKHDFSEFNKYTEAPHVDHEPFVKNVKTTDDGFRARIFLSWDYPTASMMSDEEHKRIVAIPQFNIVKDAILKEHPEWSVKLTKSAGHRGTSWNEYFANVDIKSVDMN